MEEKYTIDKATWLPSEVGERLKIERKRLGLSQDAFAKEGGVQRTTVSQYERGDRLPTLDFLFNCSSVGLDVSFVVFCKRNLGNNSEIQLKESELDRIFALVDEYGRDSRGRLLEREHRQELLRQLCKTASERTEKDIDWLDLKDEARKFAG